MTVRDLMILFVITVLTFILHEGGHWLAGVLLGYEMRVSMNSAGPVQGIYDSDAHQMIVTIAGPAVTLLQALVGFVMVRLWGLVVGFSLVFAAFMMRLMASFISLFSANDESAVGLALGLPHMLLPGVMVLILGTLAVTASLQLGFYRRSWMAGWAVVSLAITLIVFGEPWLPAYDPAG